jgi:hypothetical protein
MEGDIYEIDSSAEKSRKNEASKRGEFERNEFLICFITTMIAISS